VGRRLHVKCAKSLRKSRMTVIMAISRSGIVHFDVLDHNCRKQDFLNFIKCMPMRAGQSIVMDNIAFHHSKVVVDAIVHNGCTPIFIPPYSPRFNAIEFAFSRLKRIYRADCTRVENRAGITLDNEFYYTTLLSALMVYDDYSSYFNHVRRGVNDALLCEGIDVPRYDS
jgi:transposase